MTDRQDSLTGFLCEECGAALAAGTHQHGETRCPACFDGFLRRTDAEFLDGYARFGARSRLVVAEACLRQLVLSDISDRKLLAMSVYEQFVAAATDLIGLYHAIENRRAEPIIRGVLGFKLDATHAVGFFRELRRRGPVEFLRSLGLPHPDQVRQGASDLDRRERRHVTAALCEALSDLERLSAFEEVGERALVSAATQLRGAVALADRGSWLPTTIAPEHVAALAMDNRMRRVEVNVLSTDEDTLGAVVDGIDTMTRLTRNFIFAFVSLHAPTEFRTGFPQP